ncbi:MAG: iron ABC transporter permease [Anaerolineales bacterium]
MPPGTPAAIRYRRRSPAGLFLTGVLVVAFTTTPLVYIGLRALGAGLPVWERLARTELATLFGNTFQLTLWVTAAAAALGTTLALLVERTDLPGRAYWRWLLAVPLAVPPFISAVVYVGLLRPVGGALPRIFSTFPFPTPFGLGGAAFVLSLVTYPYIYLLAAAALRSLPAAYEETARAAGKSTRQLVSHVWLPFLRPAVAAGALLVALDCLAEYGAVAFLRYPTFSAAIFRELSGRYDRSAASILSCVLVLFAFGLVALESQWLGRARGHTMGSTWKPARLLSLGGWTPLALVLTAMVLILGAGIPVATLGAWIVESGGAGAPLAQLARPAAQSLFSASVAAALAVTLALPVAYLISRYPSRWTQWLVQLSQVGYALPGVVVALSLILAVNQLVPFLYGSWLVVALAYLLRYFPQAIRGTLAALGKVPPGMEEAARGLGRRPVRAFWEVAVPTMLPGLGASGALVLLSSLKELPATLLLRPAGFSTLAVEVWQHASEGMYGQSAAPGLILVATSMASLAFFLRTPTEPRGARTPGADS